MNVVVVVAQHHPALLALLQLKLRRGDGLLEGPHERFAAGESQHLIGSVGRKQTCPEQLQTGGSGAVLESRHERHPHGNLPPSAPESPVNFGVGTGGSTVFSQRHEISQAHGSALGGLKRGLQDIGAGEVSLSGGPPAFRGNRPAATALRVEQGGKDAATVESRETTPVDGSIQPDECCRPHVTDQTVVGYRLLAYGAGAPTGGIGRRL